jgi:hypothetical protein
LALEVEAAGIEPAQQFGPWLGMASVTARMHSPCKSRRSIQRLAELPV